MTYILDQIRLNFKFRYIFQAIFLYFSCYLLVNYLTGLVDDPAIKKGVAMFAICLDIAMQFVILARGKASWRKGKWSKGFIKYRVMALILFFLYSIYVIFYAVLSAVGFFLVEVDKKEETIIETKNAQNDNRQRLNEIAGEMGALNIQLATEGKTGYRQNSKEITARMDALKAERAELKRNSRESLTVKGIVIKSAVDSFETLHNNLGIPQNVLKILVFGISVIMLYVFIILTSWDGEVNPEIYEFETAETALETHETQTETQHRTHETQTETVKNGKKICPICGKYFPFKHDDKVFCGSKCRGTAYRNKQGGICHDTN